MMRSAEIKERTVIYQLLVRTFGNTNTTCKPGGSLLENGCGKFADINAAALRSIREMGFNHIWLTGVIEQASGDRISGNVRAIEQQPLAEKAATGGESDDTDTPQREGYHGDRCAADTGGEVR